MSNSYRGICLSLSIFQVAFLLAFFLLINLEHLLPFLSILLPMILLAFSVWKLNQRGYALNIKGIFDAFANGFSILRLFDTLHTRISAPALITIFIFRQKNPEDSPFLFETVGFVTFAIFDTALRRNVIWAQRDGERVVSPLELMSRGAAVSVGFSSILGFLLLLGTQIFHQSVSFLTVLAIFWRVQFLESVITGMYMALEIQKFSPAEMDSSNLKTKVLISSHVLAAKFTVLKLFQYLGQNMGLQNVFCSQVHLHDDLITEINWELPQPSEELPENFEPILPAPQCFNHLWIVGAVFYMMCILALGVFVFRKIGEFLKQDAEEQGNKEEYYGLVDMEDSYRTSMAEEDEQEEA
jgi:hypothetical protein